MKFKDFFVPKWQHSNPLVRMEGFKDISDNSVLVEALLGEQDGRVVSLLLSKISDFKILLVNQQKIENHPYKDKIINRYEETFIAAAKNKSLSNEEFLQGLSLIKSNEKLVRIYKGIDSKDFQHLILNRIEDEKILFKFIRDSEVGGPELEALIHYIKDGEILKKLVNDAKNKKIRKVAEKRLLEFKSQFLNLTTAEVREKLNQMVVDLKFFRKEKNWEDGVAAIENFRQTWYQLDPKFIHPLQKEFQTISALLISGHKGHEEAILKLKKLKERLTETEVLNNSESEKSHLKEKLRQIQDELRLFDHSFLTESEWKYWHDLFFHYEVPKVSKGSNSEKDNIKQNELAPQDSTAVKSMDKERIDREFRRKLQELTNSLSELKKISHLWQSKRLNIQLAGEKLKRVNESWDNNFLENYQTISLKEEFDTYFIPLQEEVDKAYQLYHTQKIERGEKIARAKELLLEVEKFVEEGDFKNRSFKPLQEEFEKIDEEVGLDRDQVKKFKYFQDQFYKNISKIREDRHWEEWANYKYRKDLLEELKRISQNLEVDFIGNIVLELQTKWRNAGRVTKEQYDELSPLFKEVCDLIFKDCLRKKRELLLDLKTLFKGVLSEEDGSLLITDTEINFKEITKNIEELTEKWRKVGQIPFSVEKEEVEKFNHLKGLFYKQKDIFYKKRDAEREVNFQEKMRLLQDLERSLAEPFSRQEKIEKIKKIQREWKAIGPVSRVVIEEGRDPWLAFKKSCDDFFGGLNEERQELHTLKENLLKELKDIISSIESASIDDLGDTEMKVKEIEEKFIEIPLNSKDLDEQFSFSLNNFFKIKKDRQNLLSNKQREVVQKKVLLLKEAEKYYSSFNYDNSLSGLQKLGEEWNLLKLPDEKREEELSERFQKIGRILQSERALYEKSEDKEVASLKDEERYLIILEQLSVINKILFPNSPKCIDDVHVDLASQLTIGLKLKGLIVDRNSSEKSLSNGQKEFSKLQEKWNKLTPLPLKEREELWSKYKKVLENFYC